jgi:hypothetical protein
MANTEFARRCAYCGKIVTINEITDVDMKFSQLTTTENEDICDALGLKGPCDLAHWFDNRKIYLHLRKPQGNIYNVCLACFKSAEQSLEPEVF